jgi:hypothetical protein
LQIRGHANIDAAFGIVGPQFYCQTCEGALS